jgi:murein DD-endopeptidase MepM/ murein hydrolase activator NlpD
MANAEAEIGSLTRAVAGLESRLENAKGLLNDVINPATSANSGSRNMLSNALGSFSSQVGSGLSSGGSLVGGIIGTAVGGPIGGVIGGVVGGAAGQAAGAMVQAGASMLQFGMAVMPDVSSVIQRDQQLYRSSIFSPGSGANYRQIGASISRTMAGGISAPGADAMGAQYMAARGIMFSNDPNSMFQSMARNASNSAKLLGMDNMTSFQSLANLTSGAGSSNLSSTFGIYTSDAMTGKSKSEDQIFNEMWGILTGGRTDISAEDIANSFYKGNLGVSLANAGLDSAQQQRFLAWAYAKAGGKRLDLSNNKTTQGMIDANKAMGNGNPIQSTLNINTTMTSSMQAASGIYEGGMDKAAQLYKDLNPQVEKLIQNFGELNARFQGFAATPTGAAMLENPTGAALTSVVTGGGFDSIGAIWKFLFGGGGESNSNGLGASSTPSGGMTMVAPASGPIGATFGQSGSIWRSGKHRGMDYQVPEGSPVHAAAPGTVLKDANSADLGHYLQVDHGNGIVTTYAHLQSSSADAHIGDTVSAGQLIGRSGKTGNVTGPHLHFAVEQNGNAIDPRLFLAGGVPINPSTAGNGKGNSPVTGAEVSNFVGTTLDNAFSTSAVGVSGSLYSASEALGVSGANNVSGWSGNASASKVGVSSSGQQTGVGGSSSGIGLASTSGMLLGASGGTKIEINLKIDQASEAEAKRFAQYVKTLLEQENLVSSMGRR